MTKKVIMKALIFFSLILFIFREREGEREGEKHQCVIASHAPSTGDPASNPVMCPDWESNQGSLVHRPGFNPLSHTSQGRKPSFLRVVFIYSFSEYLLNIH